MQSFARPHGAASLRVDSFGKLRTGSSLRSEFVSELAKTALFVIPSAAEESTRSVAKMLMRANICLNRENGGVSLFKRIAAMARIEH
jgi:hypothetical protein